MDFIHLFIRKLQVERVKWQKYKRFVTDEFQNCSCVLFSVMCFVHFLFICVRLFLGTTPRKYYQDIPLVSGLLFIILVNITFPFGLHIVCFNAKLFVAHVAFLCSSDSLTARRRLKIKLYLSELLATGLTRIVLLLTKFNFSYIKKILHRK